MEYSQQVQTFSTRPRWHLAWAGFLSVAVLGCGAQFPAVQPVVQPAPKQVKDGCRVHGRIISTVWRQAGGGIERAIVSAWKMPDVVRIEEAYGDGESFELYLPPGKYRLDGSANGTQGATFEGKSKDLNIAPNQTELDVGEMDLPISKTTSLYGQPAPELDGIIGWQDSEPLKLKDLRGHIVVVDFFAYYCTICHAHKPDLVKLRDKYASQGVIVLAIHDSSLKTVDEMHAKMVPILQRVFDGEAPKFPIALDGAGPQSVFDAYGIYAVPALILIDQDGKVVRRYHHAGKPELDADVQSLLTPLAKVIL